MSFDSLLNKTCTIQSKSDTQDAAGQMVPSWTTVASNVPCRINAIGGGEQRAPTMVYEQVTHTLFLREQSGINLEVGTYRIVVDSVNYNLLLIKKIYGYSDLDHLELLLEIVND